MTRNVAPYKRRYQYNGPGYGWNRVARQVAGAANNYIAKHGVVKTVKNAWNAGKKIGAIVKRKAPGDPAPKVTKKRTTTHRGIGAKRRGGLPAANTQWDLSTERWVARFRRGRKLKSLGQATLYHTWQKITTGNQGTQQVEDLRAIMTVPDVRGDPIAADRDHLYNAVSNIWDTHPNRKVTGSDVITAQTPRSDQMYWRTTDLKLTCTSLENLGQEVLIFWCVPKTDLREGPVNSWDRVVDAASFGVADAGNPGYGTALTRGSGTAGTYGFDPRTNPAWRKLWKVLKVHKFFLAPGETHKIHCEFKFNQLIHKEWTEGLDETTSLIPNHTIQPMCIVRGIPAANLQTGTGPGTDPAVPAVVSMGYSATKVGWIFQMKHFLTYCDGTRYNYQRVNLGIPIGLPKSETRFIDDAEENEHYHDVEDAVLHP